MLGAQCLMAKHDEPSGRIPIHEGIHQQWFRAMLSVEYYRRYRSKVARAFKDERSGLTSALASGTLISSLTELFAGWLPAETIAAGFALLATLCSIREQRSKMFNKRTSAKLDRASTMLQLWELQLAAVSPSWDALEAGGKVGADAFHVLHCTESNLLHQESHDEIDEAVHLQVEREFRERYGYRISKSLLCRQEQLQR